jgi:hypothetical protein
MTWVIIILASRNGVNGNETRSGGETVGEMLHDLFSGFLYLEAVWLRLFFVVYEYMVACACPALAH